MKKKFTADSECNGCGGTGLYQGMSERSPFAVVCHECNGTGLYKINIEYNEFSGRKKKKGVKVVLLTNPGIIVGGDDLNRFGGKPYADWVKDSKFPAKSEMREFTCPQWWYQSADYKKKPDWDKCYNNLGRPFSNCAYFKTKHKCWEEFDRRLS